MRHEGLYLPEGKGVKAQGCKGSIAGKENILRWDPLPGEPAPSEASGGQGWVGN